MAPVVAARDLRVAEFIAVRCGADIAPDAARVAAPDAARDWRVVVVAARVVGVARD